MTIARRIWKWTATIVAVVVVLLALLIGGLRLWLENSPNLAGDIVARVETATGLNLSFDRLEARLGWYGPELVFRNARIHGAKGGPTLVSARAGHVGFDVWRAVSTGRLASARVQLDGAVVHLLLQPDGVALLGQEALARGETDSKPLAVRDLPVGRVRLNDGIIVVEDERQRRRGFSIEHVRLDLDRRPSALKFALQVKLPAELGSRLEMSGAIDGSGEPGSSLRWTSTIDGRGLRFAGLAALMKDVVRLPVAGAGNVHATFSGTDLAFAHADGTFDLRDLALPVEGGTPPAPTALAGSLSVDRSEQATAGSGRAAQWRVRARDIALASGKERLRGGRADAEWLVDDGAVQRFKLKVPELPLAALGPFTALAGSATVREAGAALAPRGRITAVDLTATRQANSTWTIDGAAAFRALGIGAWRAVPGFTGLDGEVEARGAAGTIRLRAAPLSLDLARYLRAPVTATRVAATVRWSQEADGWHLASDDAVADTPDAHGGGLVRLWIPGGGEPPHLVLDLGIRDVEMRGAAKYLPLMRFPIDAVTWLDHAFEVGRINSARLQYVGPTEGFPFRDRQGLWLVQGDFSGARVHFANGWADVEDANGEVEFRNQGFRAVLRSARMGGLAVSSGRAVMADFRDADLVISGTANGDLHRALRLLQTSPVAKSLGSYFAAIDGRGAFSGQIRLDLPLRHFGDRLIDVDARLDRAALRVPGLVDEVTDITGTLHFNNLDFTSSGIRATVLGGPLTLHAESRVPAGRADGLHAAVVRLDGTASAERLMAQLDITEGAWLAGTADWHAEVRLSRLDWMKPLPPKPPELDLWQQREAEAGRPYVTRPDDHHPPPRREPESRWLPVAVHLESSLAGLALHFPAPLAKAADSARSLRADLLLDPGVGEADEVPPRTLGDVAGPHEPRLGVQASLGSDAFTGEWTRAPAAEPAETSAHLRLARGTVRFGGGGAPRLREADGVWLEGRLPRFDLSAWLRVRTSDKPGAPLSSWLKGGELVVGSFGILGFNLADLHGEFSASADSWRVQGSGPSAAGRVRVPYDLKGPLPVELDLERLTLNDRDPDDKSAGPRESPASLPAITARVGTLEFMKRKLGTVEASLSRIEGGLRLDRATLRAPSFSGQATGRWTGEGDSEWCEIEGSVHSTDVRETLIALAFEPTMAGSSADARGQLRWKNGLDATILERLWGRAHVQAKDGQILTVQPGAGRVLGLLSVANLPRRLALDFHDLTDKGLAFDSLQGDFDFRDGNAYTNNLVVKGPAADIGLVGRTGFKAQDYDQTAVVTGHFGDGLAAAGAIAGGPVIGGALFLFTKVFQGAVEGIARGYYRITGTWDKPKIDSIGSSEAHSAEAGSGALDPVAEPGPVTEPGLAEAPSGAH
jgi:uncharacterized protein YhdP